MVRNVSHVFAVFVFEKKGDMLLCLDIARSRKFQVQCQRRAKKTKKVPVPELEPASVPLPAAGAGGAGARIGMAQAVAPATISVLHALQSPHNNTYRNTNGGEQIAAGFQDRLTAAMVLSNANLSALVKSSSDANGRISCYNVSSSASASELGLNTGQSLTAALATMRGMQHNTLALPSSMLMQPRSVSVPGEGGPGPSGV